MTEQIDKSSWRTLKYFFKAYPFQNVLVIACLLLSGFAEMLGVGALLPLVGQIINSGADGVGSGRLDILVNNAFQALGITPTLGILLTLVVLAITTKAIVMFFTMRYVSHIGAKISQGIRLRFMTALMYAKWPYYNTLVSGHIANAVSEQAQRAGHCYTMAGKTTAAILHTLVYIAFALMISIKISLMAVVAGAALAFSFKLIVRMARRAGENITNNMDAMSATLNEALTGVKSIKAMGQEERFMDFMRDDVSEVCEAQKKQHSANLLLQMFYEPSIVFIVACGLYYLMTFTDITPENMLLLAFLFHRLLSHVSLTQKHYQYLAQTESALWSLEDQTVRAEEHAEALHGGKEPDFKKEIILEDIDISYDGKIYLFKDMTENIPAHKITLLFGPSGVGKTTLTDAILAFHTPLKGRVLIDGVSLEDIDLKAWRHQVGYVPQETFLFHDTVAHNITLGDDSYSKTQIEQALKDAAAWDFVEGLEEGINTVVGERGGRLSGGQRQRIALARSVIREPKLLILDEATSGLDKDTEKAVLEALKRLKKKTTIIVISHNPEMKKFADKVIAL